MATLRTTSLTVQESSASNHFRRSGHLIVTIAAIAGFLACTGRSQAAAPEAGAVEKVCANVQWITAADPQEDIPGAVVWFRISGKVPAGTTFTWAAYPGYPSYENGVIAHPWEGDGSGRYVWIEAGPDAQPFVFYRLKAWAEYPDGQACPVGTVFFQIQD